MASQKKKVNLNQELAIGAVLALCLNYICAKALSYPFLFCWLWPPFAALYTTVGSIILPCTVIAAGCFILTRRLRDSLLCVVLVVAYTQLPQGLEFLLHPGGSCG